MFSPLSSGKEKKLIRVLLVADTHLGFDLPFRPRVRRRRRGPDFFSNFHRALEPARRGAVDLVVHGGDLLYRSKVPAGLVQMAMAPLLHVAELGVPVILVPGNHERSQIPYPLFAAHPNIHIFDRPRTVSLDVVSTTIAVTGFPFCRTIRDEFASLLGQAEGQRVKAACRLLCLHQAVEGAKVGVNDFTFRYGKDVIQGATIPGGYAAVLSGHIHRAQVLTRDLTGKLLRTRVIYPGSVERTSFAERDEEKGYVVLDLDPSQRPAEQVRQISFVRLPARPMVRLTVDTTELAGQAVVDHIRCVLSRMDSEAIVRIELAGPFELEASELLSSPVLRELAPPTMNVTLRRFG